MRKDYVLASVLVVLAVLIAGFADEAPAVSLILCVPLVRLVIYLRKRYECE